MQVIPTEALQKWPVFICYRQIDGMAAAREVFHAINGWQTETPDGTAIEIDAYLDTHSTSGPDWMRVHEPYLKVSRGFILICTPGVKVEHERDDWVHHEIDWWLRNKKWIGRSAVADSNGLRPPIPINLQDRELWSLSTRSMLANYTFPIRLSRAIRTCNGSRLLAKAWTRTNRKRGCADRSSRR